MKMGPGRLKTVLVPLIFLAALTAGPRAARGGDVLFQYGAMDALLAGYYEGGFAVGELRRHGDLGLGTFAALDGEMVVVDGRVYQVKMDGRAYPAPDTEKTPFAAVTFFRPRQFIPVQAAASLKELEQVLDTALPGTNVFYALKAEGRFREVTVRSVPRQSRPYPSLARAVAHQAVFKLKDVEGVLVGFRSPALARGVDVPGYHFHFLTRDRSAGGHVLDFALENVTVQVDPCRRLELVLPGDREFERLEIEWDRSRELNQAER